MNSEQLWELLRIGGPVIAILVGLSVLGLTIAIVKIIQFSQARLFSTNSNTALEEALAALRQGNLERAQQKLASTRSPLAEVLQIVLQLQTQQVEGELLREEAQRIASLHLTRLRGQLRTLEVIAVISPLLGLLGTVMGMIVAFQQLQQAGASVDPTVLSGGIWEALLTTAAGLIVAIPITVLFNWLSGCADRFQQLAEDVLTQVFTSTLYRPQPDALRLAS